jgi:hypothetical protein
MRLKLLFVLTLLIFIPSATQAQLQPRVDVLSVASGATGTGTVSVDFVVREQGGLAITDLTTANISVNEPAENFNLSVEPWLPLTVAVMVDLSTGSDVDSIKSTLLSYIENYYESRDTLMLYILDGDSDIPRQAEINSADAARMVISGLQAAPNKYYSLSPTCDLAHEFMRGIGTSPDRPRHVVHLGSFVNSPDEALAAARLFAGESIPYHTVQVHQGRSTSNFQEAATVGGGLFVNNLNGNYVLDDGLFTPINNLRLLYDTIGASRNVYTLSYRPTSPFGNAARNVDLTVNLPGGIQTTSAFSYNWDYQAPIITFVNPVQLNPVLQPRDADSPFINFNAGAQPIEIAVEYPDGVERPLNALQLQVIDANTGAVLQSTASPLVPDARGVYVLSWSLDNFDIPDSTTDVEIVVTVEDAFGLTAELRQQGSVAVAALPATPAPTITPGAAVADANAIVTPNEAAAQDVAPTQPAANAVDDQAAAADAQADAPLVITQVVVTNAPAASTVPIDTSWLVIAGLLLLLVAIISYVWMLRTRRLQDELLAEVRQQQPAPVAAPAQQYSDPLYDTRTNYGDSTVVPLAPQDTTVIARLALKKSMDELNDLTVDVSKDPFIIGRAAPADYVLNLPYISPQHCRIRVINGVFHIRDMGSKNGTFINGERVEVGREIRVPNGSELGITKNITYEIWDPQKEIVVDERELPWQSTDRTMVTGEELVFKPLPGLEYKPDEGEPVDDRYSPI